jgi:hypothetical protein
MPITTTPTTKPQLIQSIQKIQINRFIIKDAITKNDIPAIQKELKDFIGNGAKNVSVIIIKES